MAISVYFGISNVLFFYDSMVGRTKQEGTLCGKLEIVPTSIIAFIAYIPLILNYQSLLQGFEET